MTGPTASATGAEGRPRPARSVIGDRYELGDLIGTGGTASVFTAEDLKRPGTVVAVKIMHEQLAVDERAATLFLEQAERMRTIQAPTLAQVLAFGTHDSAGMVSPWMAMEYLAGKNLSSRVVERGPLPVSEALTITAGLLAGLRVLHMDGLVHRDVTPPNVMLLHAGTDAEDVRLIDFGLLAASGETVVVEPLDGSEAQGIIGSVHYVSPEHAQGDPVDARGDVYQVGAVLYFMLTGEPPYRRSTSEQILEAHIVAPPPVPSVLRPELPAAIDSLVARAMAKTMRYRFASAADMLQAVTDLTETLGTGAVEDAEMTSVVTTIPDRTAPTEAFRPARKPAQQRPSRRTLDQLTPALDDAQSRGLDAVRTRRIPMGWLAVPIVLLVAVSVALAVVARNPGSVAAPSASPTVIAESPPEPTAAPVVLPQSITVPDLGETLADAQRALAAAGLQASVAREPSARPADTVLRSDPGSGAVVPRGGTVSVVVASGENAVPSIAGMILAAAVTELHNAGFEVTTKDAADEHVPFGFPIGTEQVSGAILPLGSVLTLLVSTAPAPAPSPTPTPTPTSTPTPSPTPTGTPPPTPAEDES